jgi:D-lactate dehydrogenase (cytochrome)
MALSNAVGGAHAAIAELKALLGTRATDAESVRDHHSRGESYHAPARPDIVCFPRSTDEVASIVRISAAHQLPIVPYGAGTSLEGHVHAVRGGISIDMRELNRVLRIGAEDLDATVEAGVTRMQLRLARQGRRPCGTAPCARTFSGSGLSWPTLE